VSPWIEGCTFAMSPPVHAVDNNVHLMLMMNNLEQRQMNEKLALQNVQISQLQKHHDAAIPDYEQQHPALWWHYYAAFASQA
jgi:hypothetical protein